MPLEHSESLEFNYYDIFFNCFFNNKRSCTQMIEYHMLVYVYSGELILIEGFEMKKVHEGECVFLCRNNHVKMIKQPYGEQQFQAVFMKYKLNFLRDFYQTIDKKELSVGTEKHKPGVIKLSKTQDTESLFLSMRPYFDSKKEPLKELMQLKLQAGIYILFNFDKRFYMALFEFLDS